MLKSIATMMAIISIGAATAAYADPGGVPNGGNGNGKDKSIAAPEMDPATATSALILLAGGLAVVRGRRGNS
ncbi:MAG: hypothetical protein JWN85_1552 [Gammaproteobacteria bacterium]|nr:hypothetical protein [Gammaproteobacteria bacterium]